MSDEIQCATGAIDIRTDDFHAEVVPCDAIEVAASVQSSAFDRFRASSSTRNQSFALPVPNRGHLQNYPNIFIKM